jgi:hypothetical protein
MILETRIPEAPLKVFLVIALHLHRPIIRPPDGPISIFLDVDPMVPLTLCSAPIFLIQTADLMRIYHNGWSMLQSPPMTVGLACLTMKATTTVWDRASIFNASLFHICLFDKVIIQIFLFYFFLINLLCTGYFSI